MRRAACARSGGRGASLQGRAEHGELAFGAIDSWLLWRLTERRVHAPDVTNALRTMWFNIHTFEEDSVLLEALDIPRALLPEVRPSSGLFGEADARWSGAAVPVVGMAGDQQAALFGHGCDTAGTAKCTYGTGGAARARRGAAGPAATGPALNARLADGALDRIRDRGQRVRDRPVARWLPDELGLVRSAEESEAVARSVPDSGGIYRVPAFTGLGAPHWDERARGLLVGPTRRSGRAEIVHAGLEAIAYQVRDLVTAVADRVGVALAGARR